MISGMVMIFVALWFYQSAVKAKASNVLMWVAIGAVGFFALVWAFQSVNIYILKHLFEATE